MQPPIALGYPAAVFANHLPVRDSSSPSQGPFLFRYADEIRAQAPQVDDRKRRQDQRLRVAVSESFNLGYLIGERVFHTDRQLGAGNIFLIGL